MELADAIEIAGKRLAYSGKDIEDLNSEKGCRMQLVQEPILELDDNAAECSDVDDLDIVEEGEDIHLSQKEKLERMKREYLTLVLNANRDYIKPGSRFKDLEEETQRNDENKFHTGQVETKHSLILKMYKELGNFEEILQDKEKYKEISPERVYKRTVQHGRGPLIDTSMLVIYNCALWTEKSRQPFDSTWLRRSTLSANLSVDHVLPGLHELLQTCRQGEWCEALFRPEAAFGRLGIMPRIPPNATIFCLLEVVKVITPDRMPALIGEEQMSFTKLFEAADEARKRGNHFYENEDYRPALVRYKSGIRLLDGITYKDEIEEKKGQELLLKLYNNCARTANAAGIPRLALASCKQASIIDDRVPKTYWHRVTAWSLKGHHDKALGCARRAMELFPHPKETFETFRRQAEKLKLMIAKEQSRIDELHRLMGRAVAG